MRVYVYGCVYMYVDMYGHIDKQMNRKTETRTKI